MAIIDLSVYQSVRETSRGSAFKSWSRYAQYDQTTETRLIYHFIPKSVDLSQFSTDRARGFMQFADYTIIRDFNPGGYWDSLDPAWAFKDKLLLLDPGSKESKKFRHKHRNFKGSVWTIKKNRLDHNVDCMVLVLDRVKMTDSQRVYHKLNYPLVQ